MSKTAVRRGRRYRRTIVSLLAIGIASFVGGVAVDQTLPGLVVYAVTVTTAVGLTVVGQYRDSVLLGDERDRQLERRASHVTFQLFGYLGLFAFIALFLLDATGQYAFPDPARPLLQAYAAICLTWGAVYIASRYSI